MGLDYSYKLYFHRQNLWDTFQGIVRISQPGRHSTQIFFPDHTLTLPLETWSRKDSIIKHDDPEFGFTLSMYFPPDDEIIDYLSRIAPEHFDSMSKESPLGYPIGYIYLDVYNDLSVLEQKDPDPDLVMFDFGTPGTRMSVLFSESPSILSTFQSLLAQNQGVCGVLNMENDARVIWLNGQCRDEWIPDPFMSPKEIEEYLYKE